MAGEKQDKMLDKQDFHIEVTRNGFNDLKDEMKEIKNEIKGTKDELKYEIKEMRSDINAGFASIKEEVHMQRDDFKEVFIKRWRDFTMRSTRSGQLLPGCSTDRKFNKNGF